MKKIIEERMICEDENYATNYINGEILLLDHKIKRDSGRRGNPGFFLAGEEVHLSDHGGGFLIISG